jgi:hypothetical protein
LTRTVISSRQLVNVAGASGARYSLLPPENATGNDVKVVQRIAESLRDRSLIKTKASARGQQCLTECSLNSRWHAETRTLKDLALSNHLHERPLVIVERRRHHQ